MAGEETSRAQTAGKQRRAQLVEDVLSTVVKVPKVWLGGMILAAIASSVTIDRPPSGSVGFHFEITTLTLVAIALIWLPAIIRMFALNGGSLKAAGMEATSGGLLDALAVDLGELRNEADTANRKAKGQQGDSEIDPAFRELTERVDEIAAEYLRGSDALSDTALSSLAESYESVRKRLPPGEPRTREMTRIVSEARVRANADPELARRKGRALLRSSGEGARMVGLALLQEAPSARAFDDLIVVFSHSSTAFEMFNALVAIYEVSEQLSQSQAQAAIDAINREKTDPRGVKVMEDVAIPRLMDEVVAALTR